MSCQAKRGTPLPLRPLRPFPPWAAGFLALALGLSLPGASQVVEELVLAVDGVVPLGENPQIAGGRVIWRRHGRRAEGTPDRLQCRDLRFAEGPTADLVEHPYEFIGVRLTPRYLFQGGRPSLPYLSAWPIQGSCEVGPELRLSEMVHRPVAANDEYLFVGSFAVGPERRLLATRLEQLHSGAPLSFVEVAVLESQRSISRTEAASDRYFVWEDRPPGETAWQIYALDLAGGLPAEPFRAIDTRRDTWNGVYLALHGPYLVFQGNLERGEAYPWGLFFVDLSSDQDPEPIALIPEEQYDQHALAWPAVSDEFIVWTEVIDFFRREAYAMRIVGGRPSGEPLHLGSGASWLEIERNIVVFNGWVADAAGRGISAIKAWELDLPGARDIGDADANGRVNISDAVVILRHLFAGGPRPRLRLADSDLDREITLFDALDVLHSLFPRGPRP